MTCRELVEFLDDYRTGDLVPAVRREFESHLRACPACVAYLQNYESTVALGRGAFLGRPPGAAPGELPEELVQAILAARASDERP